MIGDFDNIEGGNSDGPCQVIGTNRAVIQNRLLAALDDKEKVAILATKEDLELLMAAFRMLPQTNATDEILRALQQLHRQAFGK